MAKHSHIRISTRQLLVVSVVVLVACSSIASAAKCYPKTSSVTTSAPDIEYPDNDTPTVTDSPNLQTTDTPTQLTTPAPDTPEVTSPTQTTGSLESSKEGFGSLPTQTSLGGSNAEPPSTGNSTSGSGKHATFGDITAGSGKCVIGKPNAYISAKDVDWVWTNRLAKGVPQFKNFIFDQLVNNKGKLNYCVRWQSTEKLSKTVASKFEAMLTRQFNAWNEWLIGYACWPFDKIEVKIVGWATRDASLFDWKDDSLGTIYTTEKDVEGVPQCPDACYKHKDFAVNSATSACKGEPFDMSLWPTLGQGGGAGGDWGQRVDAGNMLASIDQEIVHILAHEIGHGFGLPDFYEPTDQPNEDFPVCIMKAGSAMTITPGDGWMLRRVLENIKSRYDF